MTVDQSMPPLDRWPFPEHFDAFHAFKRQPEDKPPFYQAGDLTPVYGTALHDIHEDAAPPDEPTRLDYFRRGHPYVDRLFVARFALVEVTEVPCLRSQRSRDAWLRRHPR